VTWSELRAEAERDLSARGMSAATSEARWIVEQASGFRGAELMAEEGERASALAVARVRTMVERRLAGEPLQYVLGEWSFRGIDLFVDPRVLIPRPETEVTANVAIDAAAHAGARLERDRADAWGATHSEFIVVDLGTGSGAIALALVHELPDVEIWATDQSDDALAVARANVAGAGSPATRIRLVHGDWFDALPGELRGSVRLVVSNPPYVAEHEFDDLPPVVSQHEPRGALVSGPTGLEAIERILSDAPGWLAPEGCVVLEIAPHQAEHAVELASARGFTDVRVKRDLTGRDRVLTARVQ
jgi:release factor glutamine methyltransferase